MKTFYQLTGSVLSFAYLFAGIALMSGKLDFGLEKNTRMAWGSVLIVYGIFRIYMFYRRIRSGREDENL